LIICCLKYEGELVRTPDHYTSKDAKKEFDRVPPYLVPVFEMLYYQRLFLGLYMKIPKNKVIDQQVKQQHTHNYKILY
jgi:hypothetical protein